MIMRNFLLMSFFAELVPAKPIHTHALVIGDLVSHSSDSPVESYAA
jgi:hypothetical protein